MHDWPIRWTSSGHTFRYLFASRWRCLPVHDGIAFGRHWFPPNFWLPVHRSAGYCCSNTKIESFKAIYFQLPYSPLSEIYLNMVPSLFFAETSFPRAYLPAYNPAPPDWPPTSLIESVSRGFEIANGGPRPEIYSFLRSFDKIRAESPEGRGYHLLFLRQKNEFQHPQSQTAQSPQQSLRIVSSTGQTR